MRVLIAPDKFAGTLTAVEAADAIAAGWRRQAPGDDLDLAPMADGGPGFVDVLHAALGGSLEAVTVSGPHGSPVPAVVLRVGETAYVESAQAAGLHLLDGDPETATSRGVGELVLAAVEGGARTVVVGLGGSGTNDGGAGVLAALGAASDAVRAADGHRGQVTAEGRVQHVDEPGAAVGHRREVQLVARRLPSPARGDRLSGLDGREGAGELVGGDQHAHGAILPQRPDRKSVV